MLPAGDAEREVCGTAAVAVFAEAVEPTDAAGWNPLMLATPGFGATGALCAGGGTVTVMLPVAQSAGLMLEQA